MARYQVHYGELWDAKRRYCVRDTVGKTVVFARDAKSACIAEAQRRNGFIITGNEQDYGKQVAAEKKGKR